MWRVTTEEAIEFMKAAGEWVSLSRKLVLVMDKHYPVMVEYMAILTAQHPDNIWLRTPASLEVDLSKINDYAQEIVLIAARMGCYSLNWPLQIDLRPVWDSAKSANVWICTRSLESAAMFKVSSWEADIYLTRLENAVFDAARDSKGGEPPAIDYEDIARKLRADGYATPAALVEYMAGRDVADADELKRHVHGDEGVSDDAVRKNADRATALLVEVLADTRTALIYQWRGGSISKRVI